MLEIIFIENIENGVFQNRDSITLLHGALARSNFDGLKSDKLGFHDFSDYWKCHRPLGTRIFDLGSAELLQRIQENPESFCEHIFANLRISENRNVWKRRVPNNP